MQLISFDHFRVLMGPHGLYQHATGRVPLLSEGYCTDDNARAVTFLAQLPDNLKTEETSRWLAVCWQFLLDAASPTGAFKNFRDAEGVWLDQQGTEDTLARVATALSAILQSDQDQNRKNRARELLMKLLPHLEQLLYPRGLAETITALSLLPKEFFDDQMHKLAENNTARLIKYYEDHSTAAWQWYEDQMTYANAILTHGLLSSISLIKPSETLLNIVKHSSDFLIETTIHDDGKFYAIGNNGWYQKDGQPPLYDQQPIEAATMFAFLLAYNNQFPNTLEPSTIAAPYLWFHGKNSLDTPMVNITDGYCYNGLTAAGVNPNCGAESLLAYLSTEVLAARSSQLK